ncbi:GGDEF domain-containing protein [Candidatus Magnetominusculus dajiuhuensis]|uniref:GGDEF domain-containing protein n=1 Tax=Candidatus Magnetominusculus dajiuhuensis TaxID=3137712 RepID=UPI003B430D4C
MKMKWTLDDILAKKPKDYDLGDEREHIYRLIDTNALTIHFQPVYSSKDGGVYGYEALTRLIRTSSPFNIGELFEKAKATNTLSLLDSACQENALVKASQEGISKTDSYLFINICPETITDNPGWCEITDHYIREWGLSKDKIVLEITEESAIANYDVFNKVVRRFKDTGYKIAIDDFGVGYGGLKMLSIIEPDYVKIDRHFISDVNKALIKHNLVDAVTTVCHRLGIKVIAEGIETQEELKHVMNMGIELLQGFYLQKPAAGLNNEAKVEICSLKGERLQNYGKFPDNVFIGDIAVRKACLLPDTTLMEAFNTLISNNEFRCLPVIEDDRIFGIVNRQRFLENQMLGKCGYGSALNYRKRVKDMMETQFLSVEGNVSIEDVAGMVRMRKVELLYDDISVTRNGKYLGSVTISELLAAVTEKSISLAKNANPLTGLPGNKSISEEINKRLTQNIHFDVCYIDLDNFKPYNDNYGFEKGDVVIRTLGQILEEIVRVQQHDFNFVGHIGGDDFILLAHPNKSMALCDMLIESFKSKLREFHGEDDYERGYYDSVSRKGQAERYCLLSLSIGVVSTEIYKIESFAHLASIATDVKKAAKSKEGFSIVRDKRMHCGHEQVDGNSEDAA